jgi:Zn-dependent protease
VGLDSHGRGALVVGVPREAFRPSVIFVALVALFVTGGAMAWTGFGNTGLNVFLFVVAGWLISLCLHEYAHALVAYRGGDTSVASRGYLTLNPLKYSHPLLSIAIPVLIVILGGIGLPGGAVWVDRHCLRGRGWDSLVSFAGPAMNLLFTLALVVPFAAGVDVAAHAAFWAGVAFLAFLQLTATLLNLVPIPGVDGGNLIEPWLSAKWRRGFALVAPYGMLLVFALLWQPGVGRVFFGVVFFLADLLGLPPRLYAEGYDLFTFWN